MSMELSELSLKETKAAYSGRLLSPLEVIEQTLDLAKASSDRIRAFVLLDEEGAREAARLSQRRYETGSARALEGIPISVKDIIDVRGQQTRCGTAWRQNPGVACADAEVTLRLRQAGAMIFGKTRLLECAYGNVNPDDGPCLNPWQRRRTAGGSSGGAAASIACGIGIGAIGTDTGGSIRIPAAYCGVVGLKPTSGRVPTTGVLPLSWSLDHVGPIGRRPEDLMTILSVLDGSQVLADEAPHGERLRLGVLAPFDQRSHLLGGVAGLIADVTKALQTDVARGEVAIPLLSSAEAVANLIIMAEATAFHAHWQHREDVCFAPATRRQLIAGQFIPAPEYVHAQRVRQALRRAVDEALSGLDALLMPTVLQVAPEEDPPLGTEDGGDEGRFTAPFNVTGHPAVSIPIGFHEGLPIGLQLVGHHGGDQALLAVAATVRDRLGLGALACKLP